jgi:lysophospholipase L1-like esterase
MKTNRPAILLLTAGFLLTSTALRAEVPEGDIVCLGDSITHAGGWLKAVGEKSPKMKLLNYGRPGRKTSDTKLNDAVIKKVKVADWWFIFLGVNDLQNGDANKVAAAVEHMSQLIDKIREKFPRTKVLILAPCGINVKTMAEENLRKGYNEKCATALTQLEKEYEKLAKKKDARFISLLNAVSPENYLDGLHPNPAGHQEMAGAILKGLKQPQ